jgi:transglutaminase-like putative cysteine protease
LPWPASVYDGLAAYRAGGAGDPAVDGFARALASEVGQQPLAFLDRLCRALYERTDRQVRHTGDAQSAAETLATRRGACRDLTVLFLAAARSLGFAARFCSGYQAAAQTPDGQRYLHAWPEVFCPAGWHGWDPTHGIAAGEVTSPRKLARPGGDHAGHRRLSATRSPRRWISRSGSPPGGCGKPERVSSPPDSGREVDAMGKTTTFCRGMGVRPRCRAAAVASGRRPRRRR